MNIIISLLTAFLLAFSFQAFAEETTVKTDIIEEIEETSENDVETTKQAESTTTKKDKTKTESKEEDSETKKDTADNEETSSKETKKTALQLYSFDLDGILKEDKEYIYSALFEADIESLREAIITGVVTSEELTAYYLERIQKYNKEYNCFITICEDALEVAKNRDEQLKNGECDGILFGIPIVIKDNIDLENYYTTNGHSFSKSSIAKENADVVNYLLNEGAVIIAKTNMSTDAQDSRTSLSAVAGETKNAYSTVLASGGSSGGSAVAVSLNFAAASLGTDTNSSLRLPAALNGCVALRVTTGLISTEGITALNSTRDTPGAITRTVYDQAVMLDVLTNGEYSYTENLNANALKNIKIGILSELTYEQNKTNKLTQESRRTAKNIDSEITQAFEKATNELKKCGAEIVTVSIDDLFTLSQKTFENNSKSTKAALYKQFELLLEENEIDAVIFPTYLSSPVFSGTDENGVYHNPWSSPFINNCRVLSPSAALPEITVPIGTHSTGAGIGMEIATLKNGEQLLLDIAYSYTLKYDHRIIPDAADNIYLSSYTSDLQEIIDEHILAVNAEAETKVTEDTTSAVIEEPSTEGVKIHNKTTADSVTDIAAITLLFAIAIITFTLYRKRGY